MSSSSSIHELSIDVTHAVHSFASSFLKEKGTVSVDTVGEFFPSNQHLTNACYDKAIQLDAKRKAKAKAKLKNSFLEELNKLMQSHEGVDVVGILKERVDSSVRKREENKTHPSKKQKMVEEDEEEEDEPPIAPKKIMPAKYVAVISKKVEKMVADGKKQVEIKASVPVLLKNVFRSKDGDLPLDFPADKQVVNRVHNTIYKYNK